MAGNHVNIITLGCPKNTVDSETLMRQLRAGGYNIFHNPAEISSGIVIINTCGFINDAKKESIDMIMRFIRAKNDNRIEKLYVMGCLSQRYMTTLRQEIPEVDQYFGVNDMNEILKELGIRIKEELIPERELSDPSHYAWLKISEGCNRSCSFCAIPMIRGPYLSKPIETIIKEASVLERQGVKELILIAQDLSYYGLDLYGKKRLPELVTELLKFTSFEWIRLHYLYPSNFPLELIELIQENERVCRYIDLPIQHISDRMLKLMKRSHGRKDIEELLFRIRKDLPGAAIRTTLIAGHPGETEKDYKELRQFVSEFRFDRLGVFTYSHEEDTYAGNNYRDEIPLKVKNERLSELMEIQQGISADHNKLYAGRIVKVLIDRREAGYSTGRSEHDSPEIDQEIHIPEDFALEPGNFYNICITNTEEFDLYGVPENV